MKGKSEDGRMSNPRRRDFLKLVATGAPAVAVVTAAAGQAEAAAPDLTSDRMQDTAHTRAYYDSARF
ncbi:MAG: twin-arginine translocation pathway signal protein [Roseovarius sp.]|nr:twin-arginine translocation pathway signal protein [Roseovarius sp.]